MPISRVIGLLENPLGGTKEALRTLVTHADTAKKDSFPFCHLCKTHRTPTADNNKDAWNKFAAEHLAGCALQHPPRARK